MKIRELTRFFMAIFVSSVFSTAYAATYFVTQSGAGSADGSSLGNAWSVSNFNSSSNWNSSPGTAGKISPGDTVSLNGTITSQLQVQQGGASGNVITLQFASGCVLSSPAWPTTGAIYLSRCSYVTIDGGGNGIIQNTANGTDLPLQQDSVGICALDCHFFTVQNLTVADIYVHVPGSDTANYGTGIADTGSNTGLIVNFTVTNCLIHDAGDGIYCDYGAPGCANYIFSFNTIYNCNWGGGCGDRSPAGVLTNLVVHDNFIYNFSNWDDTADANHHNGFYAFAENGGTLGSFSFYNNTIGPNFGTNSTSGLFSSGQGAVGPYLIYNNLFLENSGESPDNGLITIGPGPGAVSRIYDNTFIGGGNGNAIQLGSAHGGIQSYDVRNNLDVGTGTFVYVGYSASVALTSDYNDGSNLSPGLAFSYDSGFSGSFYTFAQWQALGYDPHSTSGNPNLNGNYVPQPVSAAIGTGTSTAADGSQLSNYFTTDKAGNPLPSSGAWNIGAFEYVPGGSVPITSALAANPNPVITSETTAASAANAVFDYTITASNSPTIYNAVGLPSGLSIDTATGAIVGIPAGAGSFNVTLSATNSAGTGSADLLLIVNRAGVAGVYFGTFSNGGNWALQVSSNNTGLFVAYVAGVAIAQNVTINFDGSFGLAGISLSGVISNGDVTGSAGSATLSGSRDIATSQAELAGSYSGAALYGASGSIYAVVGGDGRFLAVVSGDLPDEASGSLTSGGTSSGSTASGGAIALAINSLGQISANLTAEGLDAPTTYSGLSSSMASTARLANLSARAVAGPGSGSLIAGFGVSGAAKSILVRGVGPGLAAYGVAGTLANPQLYVTGGNGANAVDYFNDGWGGTSTLQVAFVQTGAFPLPPGSSDAALIDSFAPGNYSGVVTGANNSSGVALVEIYDADTGPAPAGQLSDISARAQVGTGANVLIAGFVIAGNAPETVLIRGIGPGLAQYGVSGVLANPQLDLYQGSTDLLENTGWGGGSALSAAFAAAGAFSLDSDSADSAMIVTLPPGAYTAVVSGVNNTTGVAMVEVYELP